MIILRVGIEVPSLGLGPLHQGNTLLQPRDSHRLIKGKDLQDTCLKFNWQRSVHNAYARTVKPSKSFLAFVNLSFLFFCHFVLTIAFPNYDPISFSSFSSIQSLVFLDPIPSDYESLSCLARDTLPTTQCRRNKNDTSDEYLST